MIEKTILDILNAQLTVPVLMEAPEEKPETYVLLQKTGSQRENRIDRAMFAVQSIAATLYDAAQLNETVKTVMDRLPLMEESIFRAELNSDYNFTNTQTKERRYQAVYLITYKE